MHSLKRTHSKISPRKEIREIARLRRGFERNLESRLGRFFTDLADEAADNFTRRGSIGISQADIPKRLGQVLLPFYRAVLEAFHDRVLRNLGIKGEFEDLSRGYLSVSGIRIQNISDTTRNQIMRVVQKGKSEGVGEAEIAKRIRDKGVQMSKGRARTIARTEVHSASTYANHYMAVQYMPQATQKMWVSTNDGRTRPHHRAMNGVKVPMDQDFTVVHDGIPYKLGYCGDPRGGAVNTVNCRCQTIYVPPEAEVEEEPVKYSERPWIYKDNVKPNTVVDYEDMATFQYEEADDRVQSFADEHGITNDERDAIWTYTTEEYKEINRSMRGWFYGDFELDEGQKAKLLGIHKLATDGMRKLPKFEGRVARAIDINRDQYVAKNGIAKGSTIRAESFYSTTKKRNPTFEGEVNIFIESKTGRDISKLSAIQSEEEVLFPAGTQFRVVDMMDNEDDTDILEIYLEEIDSELKYFRLLNFGGETKSARIERKMLSEEHLVSIDNVLIDLP